VEMRQGKGGTKEWRSAPNDVAGQFQTGFRALTQKHFVIDFQRRTTISSQIFKKVKQISKRQSF